MSTPCSMNGCPRPRVAWGLCDPHYREQKKQPGWSPPARPTLREYWEARVVRGDGCWLWSGSTNSSTGYGKISKGICGLKKEVLAHRLSWELHNGPIPDGLWVLHRCDNPACVRPDHLFLGTHRDNMDDKVAKGRQSQGEAHRRAHLHRHPCGSAVKIAKLTEERVTAILERLATENISYADLAKEWGVSPTVIQGIARGHLWKHVPRPAGHMPALLRRPGTDRYNSKINDDAVRAIRRRVAAGENQRLLGREFGISQGVVSEIARRLRWKHVPD